MIAVKVSDASRSLSWKERLWQGRLQEFSVDFCASVAVIYWGKEEKCSSDRKDLLFARIWIHKEGFRGRTDAGNRANRLQSRKLSEEKNDVKVWVHSHAKLCKHGHVFLCMAVSVLTLIPKPSRSTFWEWTGTQISHSCSCVPLTISACQAIQTNLAFASAILHHAKSA